MPIPLAELKKATRSPRERVLDFLRSDPTQAYTAAEIHGGIEGLSPSALAVFLLVVIGSKDQGGLVATRSTLKELERDGLITSIRHQGSMYYSLKQV